MTDKKEEANLTDKNVQLFVNNIISYHYLHEIMTEI